MKDYFFHDGTKYIIDGNKTLAMSHFHEIRAHLHQLKRVNVSDHEVVTGQKIFDDGTEAHFQLIHGLEKIEVFAPTPVVEPEEVKEDETMQYLVPVIRSLDNKYFVACLSGTFEGPYYAFENKTDFPKEAFDDNNEHELDGKLIGIGGAPLGGKGDTPLLFFVAQSGRRPEDGELEYDSSEAPTDDSNYAWKPWSRLTVEEKKEHVGHYEPLCCEEVGLATLKCDVNYSFSYSYQGYITYRGARISLPPSKYNITSSLTGTICLGQVNYYGDCGLVGEDLELAWDENDEIFKNNLLSYSGYSSSGSAVERWIEHGNVSIEDTARFAALYRETNRKAESQGEKEFIECVETEEDYQGSDDRVYTDCFNVSGESHVLYTHAKNEMYPIYNSSQNMIRYYGDSDTGLLSAYLFKPEGARFYAYHYVGPVKSGVTVTEFASGDYTHIIPNAIGIDDTVAFGGEIFMGRIQYKI